MAITWRAVVLTALGVVPVLLVPVTLVILAWALLVVLACSVDVALAASPRLLAVQRNVPPSVRLTEQTRSTLTVTNRSGRRLRALVRDAWQPSAGATSNRHPVDLPDGESRRLVTPLRPTRRGDRYADRVTVRSFGPMRLAARQVSLSVPGRLRVLPEFASRRHLPSRLARLRELDGRTAVQVRGAGTEFDSLREYVIGDDVRSIDWRATARRSEVVVRTWRPERDRRVMIVLDTARAASAGDRVDLIAFDRRIRSQVAGANGPRLLPALADALAPVEPALVEADWPGIVGAVQRRLSRRSLVVLLTALEPAAVENGLLPVVAPLRTGRDTAAEVFDAAAAERTELERAAVSLRLRQRGVEVVDALPDDLAPRLADCYLALKAAGRL